VKKARPDVPAYWLVSLNPPKNKKDFVPPPADELIRKAKDLKADGLDLSAADVLDDAYAKAVKAAGLKLYVWTVNDPAVARRMVKIGVDGITTDRPAWLREQLGR
jgi:glycerophosphoryl diester phosphodiesterase